MKPDLPYGYRLIPWDGGWLLLENVLTYRPVHGQGGSGKALQSDHRTVATFPKGSRVRQVERVALLDFMSRRPGISDDERGNRMKAFVGALHE